MTSEGLFNEINVSLKNAIVDMIYERIYDL